MRRDEGVCYPGLVDEDPLRSQLTATLAGDRAQTRALLVAVSPAMLGVLRALLGAGNPDIDDVLQEALVGFVQALRSFRGESSVLHFARSVALRRALDHRRSRARRGVTSELDEERMIGDAPSPVASLLSRVRRDAFRAVLDDLRPEQAETFAMRVLFGYSIEEIAAETRAPLETVRSRLRLAKAAIRGRIEDDPTLLELSETDDEEE